MHTEWLCLWKSLEKTDSCSDRKQISVCLQTKGGGGGRSDRLEGGTGNLSGVMDVVLITGMVSQVCI